MGDECGVDPEERRFIMVGCQDVPGFEAVAAGGKVDVEKVTPGMVAKAKECLRQNPKIRAFLMECTELPPYSDAIRAATRLPAMMLLHAATSSLKDSLTTSALASRTGRTIGTESKMRTSFRRILTKRIGTSL